ncbi:MAG: hypothetical protein CMI06_06770 [Oceanospirillaceae bacterium]|nr:hypothetical protein [Oceanospirillaceae bacterium]|tara:strand:+ start:432 stop:1049 length:618 start_codon:yes stop_codon:yes gene_type:complete
MSDNEFTEKMLVEWAHDTNLAFIVKFHNEIRRLIGNEVVNFKNRLEKEVDPNSETSQSYRYAKILYIETIEPNLCTATYLMMFSHLEEWLFNIKKSTKVKVDLDIKKGSISRFKPVLKDGLGIDISSCSSWNWIVNTEKIRNCLLHANGRIDYTKNPNEIKRLVKASQKALTIKSNRICISGEYISQFRANILDLVKLAYSKQAI